MRDRARYAQHRQILVWLQPIGAQPMTSTSPDIAPPLGARIVDEWQHDDPQPYRIVMGAHRTVTTTSSGCPQPRSSGPTAASTPDGSNRRRSTWTILTNGIRNSDQARELAAVLLQAADEVDGWSDR